MNLDHLLPETATITARSATGARDDYGNVLTANASRTANCWHEQTARDERDPVAEQTWNLYLPPDDPITRSDQVTIGGVSYEVIGAPWRTLNPRTGESWQVEATLRRTDG